MRASLSVALAALTVLFIGGTPAQAAESDLQKRIDLALAEFPGGVQTSSTTIEWEDGAIELMLSPEGITPYAVGSCATGKYCVFDGTALTGSKLSFTACDTTYSTAALLGSVRSMANARSSGTVKGKNSAGTVLTTLYAGGRLNVAPTGITQVTCTS